MRSFALGVLLYTPERFGNTRLGHILDAIRGYNQAQSDRLKELAEVIRVATTLLWNTQVTAEDRKTATALWPMPWDKDERRGEVMPEEERKRILDAQINFLNNYRVN